MSAGFNQVPMEDSSQDYTGFSTPFGCLKWLRMPMGLTGSPPTFQCLVEKVLVGLTWKICVLYLDDIIIFSSTPEEHLEQLRLVFQRFRAHNLKINPEKCDFFRMKVQFLGHIVSEDGLEVDPSKMEAVQKLPVPRSQTEVQSFFGLASYYRRFEPKFAEIARPLHKASETSTKFEWTPEAQDAFESLKLKLTSTPILFLVSKNRSSCTLTRVNLQCVPYLHKCRMAKSELFAMLLNHYRNHKQSILLHAASC